MFCTKCGNELSEKDRFCPQCGHATEAAPASGPAAAARLTLDVENKKIAGVCAGFARYLGIDVILVRIVWLVLAISGGVGVIAYLVAWILMPKERPAAPAAASEFAGQRG
ncbi:MAG TPA: PspC domain-containing protein [Bryobacteraceae bacterium]|nr:PspC domain-containing protein [Bryobacteraceae bacterium]